ncbi:Phenylacetic acid catabolic protein [Thalassovita sp.]|uniref:Phenylacetic acid catabolic protein n=1 Tax=Thalassovita sp. TaxID=1979401 RepID=UPI002B275DD4|nr:Phenylacetic acid catabolic protein [Thalassovita sp.]
MSIEDYLAQGGVLSSPDNVPPRYRAELLIILTSYVDSVLAGAAGFAEVINFAPGIRERIASARVVLEMNQTAEMILTVLEDFGTDTERYVSRHPWANRLARGADIGGKRMKEDERLAVYCYPLRGWNDAVFHNLLMARAAACQIRDLVHISYQPAAEAFRNILPIIEAHIDIADAGGAICLTEEGPEAAQASIDYWWPRVGLCFGGRETEREKKLMKLGLKHTGNQALRQLWDEDCEQALTKLGLQRPE